MKARHLLSAKCRQALLANIRLAVFLVLVFHDAHVDKPIDDRPVHRRAQCGPLFCQPPR